MVWRLRLGVSGGYSFADISTPNGFIDGGQIGHNYQMGHLVVRIEADFSYSYYLSSSATSVASAEWVGSLRPRSLYAWGRGFSTAGTVSSMQTLPSPLSHLPTPICV
jgi:hypothetical protein